MRRISRYGLQVRLCPWPVVANGNPADHNLYVGTSASELLHFVQIPPDPLDKAGNPVYILASRLSPAFAERPGVSPAGVQQILLLPRVQRACILCNWTVTFYSLPELSPVYESVQVKNCNWIGGIDLNDNNDDGSGKPVTVLLSLNRRIQVVRIGEKIVPEKVQLSLLLSPGCEAIRSNYP